MVIGQRICRSEQFSQETILQDLIKPNPSEKKSTTTTGDSLIGDHLAINQKSDCSNSPTDTGKNLRSVLLRADLESRLIVGLSSAVKQLSVQPEDTLFCILVPPKKSDSATHMQEVLLKAFCFENDIYSLHVDSGDKLGRLLNTSCESCVLIQRNPTSTLTEELLIDFCEDFWDAPTQPIVHLPEP